MAQSQRSPEEKILNMQHRLLEELLLFIRKELIESGNKAGSYNKNKSVIKIWAEIKFNKILSGDYRPWLLEIYNTTTYFKDRGFALEPYKKKVCQDITKLSYKDFLKTDYWLSVREYILSRDENRCRMCGSESSLVVHHLTYDNHLREHEHPEDLITLCKYCHNEFHEDERKLVKTQEDAMLERYGITKKESQKLLGILYSYISRELYSMGYSNAYKMRKSDYNETWVKIVFGKEAKSIDDFLLNLYYTGYFKDKDLRGYKKRVSYYQHKKCNNLEYETYLRSPKWFAIRDMVLLRDGNKCTICGESKRLNVHHKTYAHIFNEGNNLEDLQTLCISCHDKVHGRINGVNTIPI